MPNNTSEARQLSSSGSIRDCVLPCLHFVSRDVVSQHIQGGTQGDFLALGGDPESDASLPVSYLVTAQLQAELIQLHF